MGRSIPLSSRLMLSHGIVIALMLLVTPIALFAVQRFVFQVDTIATQNVHAIEATEKIRRELGIEVGDLLRKMAGASDATTDVPGEALQSAIAAARPYFTSDQGRESLRKFEDHYARFARDVRNRSFDTRTLPAHFDEMVSSLVALRSLKTAELARATDGARSFAASMFAVLITMAAAALLFGALSTWREIHAITQPVTRIKDLVRRIGEGDFDVAWSNGSIDEFNVLGRHIEHTGKALSAFRRSDFTRIVGEQRRSAAMLDSIGDGLVMFSDSGAIERINPVARRQLGIESAVDAVGKTFEQFGPAEAAARVRDLLAGRELSGSAQFEMPIERDGERRILAYSLSRFVGGDEDRPGAVMVLRDVTVERDFEKMRSEFVLRASHELRTPIASIRMGLGLLGERARYAPGTREAELLDTVQHEVLRLVQVLNDMLDLSRLRAGTQVMEKAPEDLAELVTAARARFAAAAAGKGIELGAEIEPGLPRLELNRAAFDRVLDSLLDNALRHTPRGGAVALHAARSNGRVELAVSDSGEGIAANQLAFVFQPFMQIGSRRNGAGLALAICREIVARHGGEIGVVSQLRRGSTFRIALPT